jgi:hypothetical protein
MTYLESSELMQNQEFRGRIKVSALKYADSIMIELPSVPAHNARLRWATNCFQQPDMVSQQLQPATVMDPAVQTAGSAITDVALQPAVEGVVNKML